jgi:hypothetical protein
MKRQSNPLEHASRRACACIELVDPLDIDSAACFAINVRTRSHIAVVIPAER